MFSWLKNPFSKRVNQKSETPPAPPSKSQPAAKTGGAGKPGPPQRVIPLKSTAKGAKGSTAQTTQVDVGLTAEEEATLASFFSGEQHSSIAPDRHQSGRPAKVAAQKAPAASPQPTHAQAASAATAPVLLPKSDSEATAGAEYLRKILTAVHRLQKPEDDAQIKRRLAMKAAATTHAAKMGSAWTGVAYCVVCAELELPGRVDNPEAVLFGANAVRPGRFYPHDEKDGVLIEPIDRFLGAVIAMVEKIRQRAPAQAGEAIREMRKRMGKDWAPAEAPLLWVAEHVLKNLQPAKSASA